MIKDLNVQSGDRLAVEHSTSTNRHDHASCVSRSAFLLLEKVDRRVLSGSMPTDPLREQ